MVFNDNMYFSQLVSQSSVVMSSSKQTSLRLKFVCKLSCIKLPSIKTVFQCFCKKFGAPPHCGVKQTLDRKSKLQHCA